MTHPVLGISAENTASPAAILQTNEKSDPVLGQKQLSKTAGHAAQEMVADCSKQPEATRYRIQGRIPIDFVLEMGRGEHSLMQKAHL